MNISFYKSPLIEIGSFKLDVDNPEFINEGYINDPHIVFPKNSIWIKHKGEDPFVADTSLINLYNNHQTYKRYAIHPDGDFCHWIKISPEFVQQTMFGENYGDTFTTSSVRCDLQTYLLHLQLLHMLSLHSDCDELGIEEIAIEIFCSITHHNCYFQKLSNTVRLQNKLIERIKRVIHQDIGANLNLTEIAKQSFSSPFHISRVFKKITGIGINGYRNQHRLRLIALRLQQGNYDKATLALNYGFSSHSHLSASFKKYFGTTPTQYANH